MNLKCIVFAYYTEIIVNLWVRVAHLTDSSFEAVKSSQGCDRCCETVPLNDCKGIKCVFIIISPSGYLPVS